MGIWKALFGGADENLEEEKKGKEDSQFDLFKYDGVRALHIGQTEYAMKCFEKALELREDLEVRDYLAQALMRGGNLEESLEHYQKLAEAQSANAAVKVQMAHVAYMLEDYDRMATWAEQAVEADGELARAHFVLAQARIGQGDLINGIAQLTQAVALDETQGEARLLRGQTLLGMGDVKGAEEDADFLAERLADNEDVLLLKARVEVAKGNRQEAIHIYNKVTEVNPFAIDAYRERGRLYFEEGDTKHAKEDADKLLELDPQAMADVSGDYSAEGIEQKVKQAYSAINPFGL